MNRRIVGLIAGREIRDLLRDRRSIFLLVVLPILLYPGFGVVGYLFALSQLDHVSKIGVTGLERLPNQSAEADADPPLLDEGRFAAAYCELPGDAAHLQIVPIAPDDTSRLDDKSIDVLVVIPSNIKEALAADKSATIEIKNREGDEISKLATQRVSRVLHKYAEALKQKRFARRGLPADFDAPLLVREPKDDESIVQRTSAELRDQLAKIFPFLLVMWALTGALHPAIDLCAGEKERGTMETLLISPAERSEIVAGKFMAVWGYATATAWWNLVLMAGLCFLGGWVLKVTLIRPASVIACFALSLPMTALFASLSLAIGAYARSTKEGQYYLLPLFLGVMPLVLLSMAPNAELTIGMSLIPITGLCLLLQKMIGPTPWAEVLPFLIPVMLSLTVCAMASAWWAVRQFHREDVLFRESDHSALRGWLSSFSQPSEKS
jgi:sodium transport system permease protein